jgi:hypothetical protein
VNPKQKTMEEQGVEASSLARNSLEGKGACWSSWMGLGGIDKFRLLTWAYTKPIQGG